jgi:cell division protein FtsW
MWKTASLLICLVLVLATLGVIMLASASAVQGESRYDNANHFLVRQAVWLALAGIGGVVAARIDYHRLKWVAVPLIVFVVLLLAMCLVPGVGLMINGSRRWLGLGYANFQPSELAKFAVILFLAWWVKRNERRVTTVRDGVVIPMCVMGIVLGLIFLEPDFGTTMLIGVVGMSVLFLGGTRLSYLTIISVACLCLFALAVAHDPVRLRRFLAFLHPERYAEHEAFQLMQGIHAFVSGGPYGAGLGQGLQKQYYLPEAHTDFILPIIAEELGLGASIGVLALFLGIFICGIVIVLHAPDTFGRLLAFGITLMITLQALINVGVVTGCLPTKGLALPFISYGGSSLLMSGVMVGVLVNIALHAGGLISDEDTREIKDRLRAA